jgi:hypothetical protein
LEREVWSVQAKACSLEAINKKSWEISESSEADRREKLQALSLAKECVTTKLEILCDYNVINSAFSFIERIRLNKRSIVPIQSNQLKPTSHTNTTNSEETTEQQQEIY